MTRLTEHQRAPMEWQSIETAPREGADLFPEMGPTILLATTRRSFAIGYWDGHGLGPSKQRAWICLETHQPLWTQEWTHWMPMPAPPEAAS